MTMRMRKRVSCSRNMTTVDASFDVICAVSRSPDTYGSTHQVNHTPNNDRLAARRAPGKRVQSLPRDAVLARYMLSSYVCPSVRMSIRASVTRRYCIKTAKCRIAQTTPQDNTGTKVFWCQNSRRNSNGVTPYSPTCAPNRGGVGSNGDFRPISRYIPETVKIGT